MKAFQKAQQKLSFGADEPGQANRNLGFFNDQHDVKDELLIFFFFFGLCITASNLSREGICGSQGI